MPVRATRATSTSVARTLPPGQGQWLAARLPRGLRVTRPGSCGIRAVQSASGMRVLQRGALRPALPNSSEEKQAPRGASTRPSASGAAGGARPAPSEGALPRRALPPAPSAPSPSLRLHVYVAAELYGRGWSGHAAGPTRGRCRPLRYYDPARKTLLRTGPLRLRRHFLFSKTEF